jgi:outer membrane lipoprotein-sorting protein
MRITAKLCFLAFIVSIVLAGSAANAVGAPAVPAPPDQKELKEVLHQLDMAATKFHSTSADVEIHVVQAYPVPDTEVQKGRVYYDRKGTSFQMAVHFTEDNGKPVPKVMVFSGGVFKLYQPLIDQVIISKKASSYESYLILGFGASGQALADKWNIQLDGTEMIGDVKTYKMELVAKDPAVFKLLPKVTIWIDPDLGVSLKQIFDEGQGQSRTCIYSNIKVNGSLPSDAFTFKTNSKTSYVNQ